MNINTLLALNTYCSLKTATTAGKPSVLPADYLYKQAASMDLLKERLAQAYDYAKGTISQHPKEIAAAGGALLGGGLGALASPGQRLLGALLGGGIGGGAGYGLGYLYDRLPRKVEVRDKGRQVNPADKFEALPKSITRRKAWQKALGDRAGRADVIVESAARYRRNNPTIMGDIYSENDPDRAIPVEYGEMPRPDVAALHWAPASQVRYKHIDGRITEISPSIQSDEKITAKDKTTPSLLLHETVHRSNSPTDSQEGAEAYVKALSKAKTVDELRDINAAYQKEPKLNSSQKILSDALLSPIYGDGGVKADKRAVEYATVMAELRAGMENTGVDTTSPKAIVNALNAALKKADSSDYFDYSPRYDEYSSKYAQALSILLKMPETQRQDIIKQLSVQMPGIAYAGNMVEQKTAADFVRTSAK